MGAVNRLRGVGFGCCPKKDDMVDVVDTRPFERWANGVNDAINAFSGGDATMPRLNFSSFGRSCKQSSPFVV